MKTKAFTLYELLLVLVILVILFSILLPAFAPARDSRRSPEAACMSNEKQLGLGILQYTQDNDEMMPNIAQTPGSPITWRRMVYEYVKSNDVYHCPDRHDKALGPDGLARSYGANYSGNDSGGPLDKGSGAFAGPGSRPVSISDLKNPATLISLCEVAGSNRPEFNIDDAIHFSPTEHLLWSAHFGGGSYLFADGHVKQKRPMDTQNFWYRDTAKPLSANGLAVLKETETRAERTMRR